MDPRLPSQSNRDRGESLAALFRLRDRRCDERSTGEWGTHTGPVRTRRHAAGISTRGPSRGLRPERPERQRTLRCDARWL